MYLPTREELKEIDLDNSSWQLIKRGGYMAASSSNDFRTLRKNNIYFFTEGSAFDTPLNLKGKYADLKPQWNEGQMHPVWRDGQPIFIEV